MVWTDRTTTTISTADVASHWRKEVTVDELWMTLSNFTRNVLNNWVTGPQLLTTSNHRSCRLHGMWNGCLALWDVMSWLTARCLERAVTWVVSSWLCVVCDWQVNWSQSVIPPANQCIVLVISWHMVDQRECAVCKEADDLPVCEASVANCHTHWVTLSFVNTEV